MKKKLIAVFFGGRSAEYAVSLRSASAVLAALSPEKYEPLAVGITRAGEWLATRATPAEIAADCWQAGSVPCLLSPDRGRRGLYLFEEDGTVRRVLPDVLFPVLHGAYGEDGCMQGLFALCGIPHVGCGTQASAIGMDKAVTKTLCAANGIPTLPFLSVLPDTPAARAAEEAEGRFAYPMFVKPATGGSSIGAAKAGDRAALCKALSEALSYGRAIVEPFLCAREIEVAVTNGHADGVGEIKTGDAEFYDYDTKYGAHGARLLIPAPLSARRQNAVMRYAEQVFSLLDCRGGVRVDFFLTRAGQLYLNEINTLPGFTDISMYPRLAACGAGLPSLLDRLIEGASPR